MSEIKKIAVFGSGVMGATVAAQCANAGYEVLLYDIVPEGAEDRNVVTKGAIEKLKKMRPAAFMSAKFAERLTPLNIEDHLDQLSDVDWIIEAVIEDLRIKEDLFKKIDAHRKTGSIVSSNTSTIPLKLLLKEQSDNFKKHFVITHFFNPPRYMRLLEVVKGEDTSLEVYKKICDFCDRDLGKGVVDCNDRPGFIANRIGIYWNWIAIVEAKERGITVEEADAMMGKPIGVPRTAVFGLADLIGIDLYPHISKSMLDTLPKTDAYFDLSWEPGFIMDMIKDGYTGRKGRGGFYVMEKTDDGKKLMKVRNLQTGEYEPQQKVDLDAVNNGKIGIKGLVTTEDKYGEYAWAVMSKVLVYAASLVPEIANDIYAVDGAMKMGFGWKFGPFELIDQLGPKWFAAKLREEGRDVPELLAKVDDGKFFEVRDNKPHYFDVSGTYKPCPRPDGVVLLSDIKLAKEKVAGNDAASIWDVGDGVLCIEFHTKMNAMDPDIFAMYHKALELIGDGKGDYKALIVHNEGRAFSAGANLGMFIGLLNTGQKDKVEDMIAQGQETYKKLKFAPFPVVAAPTGMALGGGCEILLHVDAVTAHAETYMGLVEIGVGLLPAWGGCKEMLLRYKKSTGAADGSVEPVKAAFQTISTAKTSTSAADAFDIGYLRDGQDSVVMNVERLLSQAKKKALELADGYQPPAAETIALPGESAKLALEMAVNDAKEAGKATDYDAVVCGHIATVLTGGEAGKPLSEDGILSLERAEFMKLCDQQGTLERIQHMLEKGKPLRN